MYAMTGGRTILHPTVFAAKSGTSPTAFFQQQKRMYHEVRIGMFDRVPKLLISKEVARDAVNGLFTLATKADFLSERMGCLSILTVPEFGFNLGTNYTDGGYYTARSPLSMDVFKELVAEVRRRAGQLPPGYLFVFGGIAVNTGQKVGSGKIKGLNLGFLVESGPTADCVLYSKMHHDPVDYWDKTIFEPSLADEHVGPLTRTVKDPSGGRSVVITAMICADMISGPLPKDMASSDVVLCSSAGTPIGWEGEWLDNKNISEYATVAVNELHHGTSPLLSTQVKEVGQVPKHPWLQGLHSMASWAGFGDFALAFYRTVLGVSPTELLATQLGFKQVALNVTEDGQRLVTTGPRPLLAGLKPVEEVVYSSDKM